MAPASGSVNQTQKDAAESHRQITCRNTELHAAQAKIQALTLELAHLRRMRFGARSEALFAEQRDLFQETLASDLAAADAEMDKRLADAPQIPRPPAVIDGGMAAVGLYVWLIIGKYVDHPALIQSNCMIWFRIRQASAKRASLN